MASIFIFIAGGIIGSLVTGIIVSHELKKERLRLEYEEELRLRENGLD